MLLQLLLLDGDYALVLLLLLSIRVEHADAAVDDIKMSKCCEHPLHRCTRPSIVIGRKTRSCVTPEQRQQRTR